MPNRSYYVGKCPPGVICVTPGYTLLTILLLVAVAVGVYMMMDQRPAKETVIYSPQPQPAATAPVAVQIAAVSEGDSRFMRAPKPERHWITSTEFPTPGEIFGKLPRVPTRGMPETYQSMGVMTMDDGQILPIYGRRTASRSDRFQYYTRTDTYNPVQLPLRHKRRDCQDDIGCEELFDGDSVTVGPTNQVGRATIYRFDGPTYVP
jgi:hypothetical protein